VLELWRKAGRKMLVLILAARDHWTDRVAGFDAGADDYLVKPFCIEELLVRLRALLRRAGGIACPGIEVGLLRIDTRSARVTVDGNPVKLTSLEYRLLSHLARHKGQVLSRTDLVEYLYDQDFRRHSNTIEVFIGRLRKKLGVDVIRTMRGRGYRLDGASAGPVKADPRHSPSHLPGSRIV
jgi:two-component system OmpR family response regulator